MPQTEWRPDGAALADARNCLRKLPRRAARVRLAVIETLLKTPTASIRDLAQSASTRPKTVVAILERWQQDGNNSLASFGRPKDLGAAALAELKRAIAGIPLTSLTAVDQWLRKEKNLCFTSPTLRRYCAQLGFDLPAKFKKPLIEPKSKKRRQPWTVKQTARLGSCGLAPKNRIGAVLRAGTELDITLEQIATECRVPVRTLTLDLQIFRQGGLRALAKHFKRKNILLRKSVWLAFSQWCDEQYKNLADIPTAMAAGEFLKSVGISMPLRTVYTHLNRWRQAAGIPPRRRRGIRRRSTPIQNAINE